MKLNYYTARHKAGRKDDYIKAAQECLFAIAVYILMEWISNGTLAGLKLYAPAGIIVVFIIRLVFPDNYSRVYKVAINDKDREVEIFYYNAYDGHTVSRIPFEKMKLSIYRKGRTGPVREICFYPKNRQAFELKTGRRKFLQADLDALADQLETLTHASS